MSNKPTLSKGKYFTDIDGKRVKYAHFRSIDQITGDIYPTGGATVAYIGGQGKVEAAGISYCSDMDNFRHDYGRAKALGRLMQGLTNNSPGDEPVSGRHSSNVKFIRDWTVEEVDSELALYGLSKKH